MRTVRLALLVCDELTPTIVTEHGDYAQIFHRFLALSLAPITQDVTFTLEAFDVVKDMVYPPDDSDYDGILISGSRTSAYDDIEWVNKLVAYVKRVIASKPRSKIFGMCFGHQIIAMALGFGVKRCNWEVSIKTVQLTSAGKAIFQTDALNLQLMHHDEVSTALPGAQLLGSTVAALNQGFVLFDHRDAPIQRDKRADALRVRLTSIHVLAIQAHPEFTEPIVRTVMAELGGEVGWDEAFVEEALSRVGAPTDAIAKVGRAIWGVLGVASMC